MVFKKFTDSDIVIGRVSKVSSGVWPDGQIEWDQSKFTNDFWDLTNSATPSPAYGASFYDIRRTAYYINVFPSEEHRADNDPYFTLAYGHIDGSGSFILDRDEIKVFPTKVVYTQYKNMLLGNTDLDGKFSFKTGSSSTVDADDIFVLSFSSYKLKDRLEEGGFEISFSGSKGCFTFIDDSITEGQGRGVYNLISGSLDNGIPSGETYKGIGLLYPSNGIVIFNASKLNELVGLNNANYASTERAGGFNYSTDFSTYDYTHNHKVIFEAIKLAGYQPSSKTFKARRTEYFPSRHYFVRVGNREFNYSNNPTYVHDGSDGKNPRGTIYHSDFITEPRTYITTVGLYDESNDLVAVAKLSRPVLKTFNDETLIKCRLDF